MIEIIVLAFLLDYIIGDPQNPFHPIRIIGNGIGLGVRIYKKIGIKSNASAFLWGAFLSVSIVAATYFFTKGLLSVFYNYSYWFGFAVEVAFCYFAIAAGALKSESMKVYYALKEDNVEDAKVRLSYIVGRDTKNLTPPDIIKATVETVAENLSDGVIAPLIFIYIGGAPLGFAYKAINTLDSMIGYRNEDYEYFGKFAARLDDTVNFVPSRISAILMILATIFTKSNTKRAISTFIKDRYKHKSPNSAQTESVCAGALGITLGGDSFYHGKLVHKPTIGESEKHPSIEHIIEANSLMYIAAILLIGVMVIINYCR